MRFTWGHAAIAIPVTIVVVFTTVLIRSMADEHKTELVTKDYYAKELAFQDQIDQTKNALLFHTVMEWTDNEKGFELKLTGDYSPENVTGTFKAFRPSSKSLDFDEPIQLDSNGVQSISANKFQIGKYQIQISWNVDGTDCYLEKNIFIQ
ncbi:MAG TPA: hypothetical protein EYP36_10515 [Calditrichaeota bacterium]|nr:hypothetical protein [Calditrichota bacterium]